MNNKCRKNRLDKKIVYLETQSQDIRKLDIKLNNDGKYNPNVTHVPVYFVEDKLQGFIDFLNKDKKRHLNLEKAKWDYLQLLLTTSRKKVLKENKNKRQIMRIANEKVFKIKTASLYLRELEWLEALQKAEGWVNESIISFCDRYRLSYGPEVTPQLLEAIVNYLTKIFGDFSILIDTKDGDAIKKYFSEVKKPNYYSIKEFIITEITKVRVAYEKN